MEDNNTNMPPEFCAAGCGFYANKIYNNMCSKCYKLHSQNNTEQDKMTPPAPPAPALAEPSSSQTDASANTFQPSSPAPAPVVSVEPSVAPVAMDVDRTPPVLTTQEQIVVKAEPLAPKAPPVVDVAQVVAQAAAAVASAPPEKPAKPVQSNKGRCFVCRAKIPLAKQTINKCRCEYVFCDNHHYPEKHDCEFDFVTLGKDILAKNNPKLNERPKGGRSFTRIDNS